MTDAERREASRQFYNKWVGRGKEDEDDRSYWLDILDRILGVENVTDHIEFQKKVIVEGNTKRIDAYIPETKVIIEQKTLGIELDKKGHQSGGIELTPYEQAKRYNDNLPYDEKARWIVTSNFSEIWIYDMNTRVPEPVKITLADLQTKYTMLDFLINQEQTRVSAEMEVSVKAGELVGIIYDALYKQYIDPESERALKSLNMLCVRLVFCLYAEDAGIFSSSNRKIFHDYLVSFDAQNMRKALIELFKILDTKPEDRDPYDTSDLSKFPYVNGGLFADENIEIPNFTEEIKTILLANASDDFDWSAISPTIFGAVFESTLNPETRRAGGMHYTSIENIHKVIDPLFLDDLRNELEEIKKISVEKTKDNKLKAFQSKLASLRWFDPACGSGNFLTETYISIRRLENEVLLELQHGQIVLGEAINPIQVSINQFYGIEINDFAVTVAKTALWIAESQMMKETEDVVRMNLDFLPLKTNANIVEGNSLSIDWDDFIPKYELNYIMGNPPFVGARQMKKDSEQKKDMIAVFENLKGVGNLDYVCAWYKKSAEYIKGCPIKCAFVSTNSISQGEQPELLWKSLMQKNDITINFAYRTFKWESDSFNKATVHCVIIGFSNSLGASKLKKLFYSEKNVKIVDNINAYLLSAPNVFVESRKKPLCNVSEMVFGSMPNDGGFLSNYSPEEMNEITKKYPQSSVLFKKFLGADEYIKGKERYCLWLDKANPSIIKNTPPVMDAIKSVKEMREASSRESTRKLADTPQLFGEIRQPENNYLVVPRHSSENRRYIPIGYIDKDVICGDSNMLIPNATLYEFGVLMSSVHMAWMRAVCGRLEMRYRYSSSIVYNNFPWPNPTDLQKENIIKTAQGILETRALFTDSLSVLYNPLSIPPELQKAHNANNRAVMQAYGFSIKDMSEEDCVAELMKLYEELTK